MKVKFGEVAERLNIKVDQKNTDLEVYVGGEHIESRELLVHHNAPIKGSTIGYQFQFGFEVDDILFMTKNPHLRKSSLAKFRGLCSIATFVIRAINPKVLLQEYLAIEMQSDRFWNYCEEHKSGGVNYFINWGTLSQYEFDLPPIEIQRVISEKVWAAYRLKEAYKRLLTATDEMVKSQFLEMFGNEKWEQKPLGEIGSFKRGGGFQKSDYVEHGIPCIHYGQIHTKFGPFISDHISEISSDLESKTKFAYKGNLIIAITSEDADGSCKSTAWLGNYPVAVGGHAAIFQHCMNPIYLTFFFKSPSFSQAKKEYLHESKVVEIRPDDIAKILVPIPPMELQEQFETIARQADKSKYYELN